MGWWGYIPPAMYCEIAGKEELCSRFPGKQKMPGIKKCEYCDYLIMGKRERKKRVKPTGAKGGEK